MRLWSSVMSTGNVELRAASIEALPRLYEPAAYSIEAFCRAHSISRSKLYEMLRSGEGPRFMKCGTRTLISVEAARDWRLARERAAVDSSDGAEQTTRHVDRIKANKRSSRRRTTE
jgi:hypothetical protein